VAKEEIDKLLNHMHLEVKAGMEEVQDLMGSRRNPGKAPMIK
jgi:hypothetical protein